MAMHTQIRGIFQGEGLILSLGSKHGLPVMAALCSQHKIAAESLCDKWRVFAEMHDMDDGAHSDMVLLQKFADSVKKQLAGAPSAEAVRLVELLTSDDAEARHRGYAELESADAAAAATPTVVEALVEGALCSAQVEAAEYRQVCALMGDLMFREEGGFDVELIRQGRWIRAWEAPALLAAANKPPAEMTREDALVVAADLSVLMMTSRGWTHHHQVAGEDEMVTLSKALRHPLYPERAAANPYMLTTIS